MSPSAPAGSPCPSRASAPLAPPPSAPLAPALAVALPFSIPPARYDVTPDAWMLAEFDARDRRGAAGC